MTTKLKYKIGREKRLEEDLLLNITDVIISERVAVLALFLVIVFVTIVLILRKETPTIRKIPGLTAIDEGVGRAVEMGRPVHYTTGGAFMTGLTTRAAPEMIASLSVFTHVSRLCANRESELLVSLSQPEMVSLIEETMRETYMAEGKADAFKLENIQAYPSHETWPMALGMNRMFQERPPGTTFTFGPLGGEAVVLLEPAAYIGAFQVAGCGPMSTSAIPVLIATCDYVLLTEEFIAAGAYLSGDPAQARTIAAQDVMRFVVVGILLVGFILSLLGIPWLDRLLRM